MRAEREGKTMNTYTLQKNDVVFRQEEFAESMYKILSGSVRIVSDYGKESEKEITVLKDGDFFGEMGLVETYPRSATAVVSSASAEVTEFGVEDCQRLFADDPESVRMILRQLAERIGKTNQDYMDAAEVVRKAKEDRTINAASDTTPRTALQRLHDYYLSFLRR